MWLSVCRSSAPLFFPLHFGPSKVDFGQTIATDRPIAPSHANGTYNFAFFKACCISAKAHTPNRNNRNNKNNQRTDYMSSSMHPDTAVGPPFRVESSKCRYTADSIEADYTYVNNFCRCGWLRGRWICHMIVSHCVPPYLLFQVRIGSGRRKCHQTDGN